MKNLKNVLKNFPNTHRKAVLKSIFNQKRLLGLQIYEKNKLQHRCIPENIVKFLGISVILKIHKSRGYF